MRATLEKVAREARRTLQPVKLPDRAWLLAKIKIYVRAHIRYAGTDTALIVDAGTIFHCPPHKGEGEALGRIAENKK